MRYVKYHGLGNDYLVIRPTDLDRPLDARTIQLICDRHYGVGSDGILLGPVESHTCDLGLRIFNPDGSKAEKSGNGLRIFARYAWEEGLVEGNSFTVETLGGPVVCHVQDGGRTVTVEMGRVSFMSTDVPVTGEAREVLREHLWIDGTDLEYCAASLGNPHCVVLCEQVSAELARQYGPSIESHPRFPHRTNVQFLQILDRQNIQIEIWERGAGYTLASGSSSTAAAAVAHKLGLCESHVLVHMPGGSLTIQFSQDFAATMTGPVSRVCQGIIDPEIFELSPLAAWAEP